MDEIKRYRIQYSEAAEEDIFAKAEYIEKVYRDSRLAYRWYTRLRNQITEDLSFLPYKYQPYPAGSWADKGVREYIFRNDIVLYSIDEPGTTVIIHAVFTKGKNIVENILDD